MADPVNMPSYRKDIEAMRGFAIIIVLIYHLDDTFMPHGYLGVDIFFVLSGYLTSKSLLRRGDLLFSDIMGYWQRRIWRLIPGLLFVAVVAVLASWMFLSPIFMSDLSAHTLGLSTFASNIVYWKTQGYFSDAAGMHPLLHTWSLSLEFQFYFIAPVIILILITLKRHSLILIIILIALSFGLSVWAKTNAPVANFYLLPARMWQFALGMLAFELIRSRIIKFKTGNYIFGFPLLVGLCIFNYIQFATQFAFLNQTLVSFLTFAVLLFNTKRCELPGSEILSKIGVVSYSLYLVHQPIIVLYKNANLISNLNGRQILLLSAMSLMSAVLVHKVIESRFRSPYYSNLGSKSLGLIILYSTTLCALGMVTLVGSHNIEKMVAKRLVSGHSVIFQNMDERKLAEYRITHAIQNVDSIVLGSSRAMQIDSSVTLDQTMNIAVSGAALEDIIGIGVLSIELLKPKVAHIVVDPWLFNANSIETRWHSIAHIVKHSEQVISNRTSIINSSLRKIKSESLNEDVGFILRRNQSNILSPSESLTDFDHRTSEGRHIYGKLNISEFKVHDPQSVLNYHMQKFNFSENSMSKFMTFLQWVNHQDVQIKIIFAPYSPSAYFSNHNYISTVQNVEQKLRSEIENIGSISFLGSYNPQNIKCLEKEFYDALHPNKDCITRLFVQ